ncbi:hypothetical protein [Jidongwangia harbinensis]|uniref:hypothetical protein n=1 Tax=Jidongwangia harbinensis TaxID=2878561 RepID=UPI001CD9D6C5|nr:hypothetical protein [Jidongwangia harbinensis]MCA2213805.1 hypothetical protein [Jidongwangia harbinensis]
MARRVPRLLVPIAVTLLAMVLAFWTMKPSVADDAPPPAPTPTTQAPDIIDLPRPPKPPVTVPDQPNGPKDCAGCVLTDPV